MKDAEKFAPQSYYDAVIAAVVGVGLRFITQVQITTDDLPYHVQVDAARNTSLVFDIPGKAVFVRLYHHENTGLFEQGYQNHWSISMDLDYGEYSRVIDLYVSKYKTFDEEGFNVFKENLFKSFQVSNRYSTYHSSTDGDITFRFELPASEDGTWGDPSTEQIVDYVKQALGDRPEYVVGQFRKLMMLWEPGYTFSGEQGSYGDEIAEEQTRKQDCKNLYWERFGDARKIILEKVLRSY